MQPEHIDIDPQKFFDRTKIDIIKITEGGVCPEGCIHCGASPEKGDLKEITPDQIERNLTQKISNTRKRVADALARFVTTDVDMEPLYTESFIHFAKLVHSLTEGNSQAVCITHGLRSTRNRESGIWTTAKKNTEILTKIKDLMLADIIPLTVISMDAARENAELGCKSILKDKDVFLEILREKLKNERSRLVELEELWEGTTARLEEMHQEIEPIQFERTAVDEVITCMEEDELAIKAYAYTKGMNVEGAEKTYDHPEEDRSFDEEADRNDQSYFLELANDCIARVKEILAEFAEINEEIRVCKKEIERISKEITIIEHSQEDEEKAVIESNAHSYAATIKILYPAILEGKRITISVQGDKNNKSPVSMDKSDAILAETWELLAEDLGPEQVMKIRRKIHVEARYYVAVGNAVSKLGMTDDTTVDVIPDQEFMDQYVLPSYPVGTVHRGKVNKAGEIDIQKFRPSSLYNDTVAPKKNPWLRVNFVEA